jgi:beta-N-acetylhexosaminidase
MKTKLILFSLLATFSACNGQPKQEKLTSQRSEPKKLSFNLSDFYSNRAELDAIVAKVFSQLNTEERLAQMIITSAGELGKPQATVANLVKNNKVGGVIFLKGNGSDHKKFIDSLNAISAKQSQLPLIYSIDAEPSLINSRLPDVKKKFPKTIDIKSPEESAQVATDISKTIKDFGFHYNYAPVVDLSPNNEAIKSRSFGSDRDSVIAKAKAFIEATQDENVVSCAKHFPGHGFVEGDTHKKLVYIDGELKEVDVYKPLIEEGVLSIMIAHIAVENNEKYGTDGAPASISKKIVTDLLRNELGFEGIITTDAMNMVGATSSGESAPFLSAEAGCDMILMPPNETALLKEMQAEYEQNEPFRSQIDASVKRILKLKICLRLIE